MVIVGLALVILVSLFAGVLIALPLYIAAGAALSAKDRRFQFGLKALLLAMLVVATFFGGMAVQKALDLPVFQGTSGIGVNDVDLDIERIRMRDGSEWYRAIPDGDFDLWSEKSPTGEGEEYHLKLPDGSHWRLVEGQPKSG